MHEQRSRSGRLLAVACSRWLAACVAACGDDDDDDASRTTTAGDEEPPRPPTATAAAASDGWRAPRRHEGHDAARRSRTTSRTGCSRSTPTSKDFNYARRVLRRRRSSSRWPPQIANTDGIEYASEINGVTRGGEKCTTYADCLGLDRRPARPTSTTTASPARSSSPATASRPWPATASSSSVPTTASTTRTTEYMTAKAPRGGRRRRGAGRGHPCRRRHAEDRHAAAGDRQPRVPRPTRVRRCRPRHRRRSTRPAACSARTSVHVEGDSGDTATDTANQTVDRLLAENVDAIIGAASSAVTLTVIDKITGAGVVDVLAGQHVEDAVDLRRQGPVLPRRPVRHPPGPGARRGHRRRRHTSVGILALDDAYGTGLAEDLTDSLRGGRRRGRRARSIYDPQAADVRRRGRRGRRPPTPTPSWSSASTSRRRILAEHGRAGHRPERHPGLRRATATWATPSARTSTPASSTTSAALMSVPMAAPPRRAASRRGGRCVSAPWPACRGRAR